MLSSLHQQKCEQSTAPTPSFARSIRPFASVSFPSSEFKPFEGQINPGHTTHLTYSIATLPLFPSTKRISQEEEPQHRNSESIQNNENKTGLPDTLKAGIESLSGISMDDVHVHYNSSKPAQVQALAYTQGAEIHVGPSQERHLPHEAWHVVQQKQGRVKPTLLAKDVAINDDAELEGEADVMGERANIVQHQALRDARPVPDSSSIARDLTDMIQPLDRQVVQNKGQAELVEPVHLTSSILPPFTLAEHLIQRQLTSRSEVIQMYRPQLDEIGDYFQVLIQGTGWVVAEYIRPGQQEGEYIFRHDGNTIVSDEEGIRQTTGGLRLPSAEEGTSEGAAEGGLEGTKKRKVGKLPGFARGTYDERRFSRTLKLTMGEREIEGDDPLSRHMALSEGLGTGKKRGSENQVKASLSLLLQHSKGNIRIVTIVIPHTFTSGEQSINVGALITWLVNEHIIGSREEYNPEQHAHSEQGLVQYLLMNGKDFILKFVDLIDFQESVVGVVLDLVSAPNTICVPCHQSLENLMASNSQWLQNILAILAFHDVWIEPEVKPVIRASAENVFTGAKVQFSGAQEKGKIEEITNLKEGTGSGPLFLETVKNLDELSKARSSLINKISNLAAGELNKVAGKPGLVHKIERRLGINNLPEEMIGTRIFLDGKIWQVHSTEDGVSLELKGFYTPSTFINDVERRYGTIHNISGAGLNCYIRSIVTRLSQLELLHPNDIEDLVSALEDTLKNLGLRTQGEMIDAGDVAADVVRAKIADFLNLPNLRIGIRIVMWNYNTGQITSFDANEGDLVITLLYTPGHFDLIQPN